MANQVMYGFLNLVEFWEQRAQQMAAGVIDTAIMQSVAEHNAAINALMGLFVTPTTNASERYLTPSPARLQPLSDHGRALPILPGGKYDVGFPIQDAGAAWGATYKSRTKLTVAEANRLTSILVSADAAWMRDHILAACFTNAPWTFDDEAFGALTIQGMANGDGTLYQVRGGVSAGKDDNHYLAQAAAVSDTDDPFPGIEATLSEHPDNDGEVVAFIPSNLKAAVTGLASFVNAIDPNITVGAGSMALNNDIGVMVPGDVLGYHSSKVWLVEWAVLPDDYIVATTTAGATPLGMRQEPETELQGFTRVGERDDHPYWEAQYARYAGFGARNRVGAVVQQIGAASYTIPTGWDSPMP